MVDVFAIMFRRTWNVPSQGLVLRVVRLQQHHGSGMMPWIGGRPSHYTSCPYCLSQPRCCCIHTTLQHQPESRQGEDTPVWKKSRTDVGGWGETERERIRSTRERSETAKRGGRKRRKTRDGENLEEGKKREGDNWENGKKKEGENWDRRKKREGDKREGGAFPQINGTLD